MSKRDKYSIYEKDGPIGDFSDNGPDNFIDKHFTEGFLAIVLIVAVAGIVMGTSEYGRNKNTQSSKLVCDCKTVNYKEQSQAYECVCRSNSKNPAMYVIMREKTKGK